MLSFSTEFAIDPTCGVTAFLDTVKAWIVGSPHTKLEQKDLDRFSSIDGFTLKEKNEEIEIIRTKIDDIESAAVKRVIVDESLEWITELIFSKTATDIWLGIRVSREAIHPALRLPPAKKPIIVRAILDSLGGGTDGELRVSEHPHFLNNNDISLASRLITGDTGCRLPVVYVSCELNGKYSVDADSLAHNLSGMAHVVVEPNRPFSRRLQIEVSSENVYGGAVGIYWPGAAGRRSYFSPRDFESRRDIKRAIYEEIRTALMNRRPLPRCTWAQVQEYSSRIKYNALRASGSDNLDEYISTFDAEIKAKSDRLDEADAEIFRLQSEIRKYEARTPTLSGVLLKSGNEQDFFPGEIFEIIMQAIEFAEGNTQENSRRAHVLKAIIESNPITGELQNKRENIKNILRDYRDMDSTIRAELKRIGFDIFKDGKHYKLIYQGDERYTIILSRTGSDHRGGLNSASDIAKHIF